MSWIDLHKFADAILCMIISWKCSIFNTLSMDKVSMSHLISFSGYQTKCVLSSYLDSWWPHKLLRFFLNQPLKQWLIGKKRMEDKNTKIWISQERKELFKLNKKHCS